jgi:hypothetical protein
MPLTLPNLDDRTFDELVAEMRSRIPPHAPEWTNHNPSDPGITLLELFAFFGDALMYRIDRVSAANRWAFVRLLEGPDWSPPADGDLDRAMRDAVLRLRETARAVTPMDVERLALEADPAVARSVAVANRDLDSGNPSPKLGHVSVVVVPMEEGAAPTPDEDLIARVASYLESRRMLGTRIHVVPPRYVPVSVRLDLTVHGGADADRVRALVAERLTEHLHPLRGGSDGAGWPLGRDVAVSDLYRLAEEVPGVDHVRRRARGRAKPNAGVVEDELAVPEADAFRLVRNEEGELVAIRLRMGELVHARVAKSDITVSAAPDGTES